MSRIIVVVLGWGASFPTALKRGLVERIFKRALLYYRKKYVEDPLVYSNLGINNNLKIALPVLQAPPTFFFGNPKSYTGEYYTIRLGASLARHCAAFIDVGANWGFFSYYISNHNPALPIYWFEPNSELFNSITANSVSNRLNNMHGSTLALSDTNGAMTFYVEAGAGFNSSLIKPAADRTLKEVTVDTVRFDDWLNQNNTGGNLLVKVDVENAEWHFIKGAVKAMDKVSFLIIEVLGPARQSGFINYMIQELGLNAYYINENKIEHVLQEDMRYTGGEYNWLFCRLTPELLQQHLTDPLFKVIA